MSLINDALKRAKQAQQQNPAPPVGAPALRPVDPQQQPTQSRPGLMMPAGLAVVAVVGALLLCVLWKKQSPSATVDGPATLTAAARTPDAPVKQVSPGATTEHSEPAIGAAKSSFSTARADNLPVSSQPDAPGTNLSSGATSVTNQAGNLPDVPATNRPALEPAPPPLRLQSIVFNPRSPSAMINGRVVFVGDRIRDLRVTAIHRDEVLLVGGGTNLVLSLE